MHLKDNMVCNHRYFKVVRNYGKNSKPSYRVCKKCGKVLSNSDRKNKNGKK